VHSYETDEVERPRVIFWLAVGAMASGFGISRLAFIQEWYFPFGALTFFGAYFFIFDRWVWRWRVARILSPRIPDFSGTWVGTFDTQFSKVKPEADQRAVFAIRQRWTTMFVSFETANGKSESTMAAVLSAKGVPELQYKYDVRRKRPDSPFPDHEGFARMSIERSAAEKKLCGYYFTGGSNDVQHSGSLDFSWRTHKLLSWSALHPDTPCGRTSSDASASHLHRSTRSLTIVLLAGAIASIVHVLRGIVISERDRRARLPRDRR
jgi:hypothetical protein